MATLPTMTVEELKDRSEIALDNFKEKYLENLIRQGIDRINTRWGARVAARLRSGVLPVELYKDVVARSVMRVVRNPEGYTSEQEGNYQYSLRAQVASGYLWFTDDDVIDLLGVTGGQVLGTKRVDLHGGA